MKFERTFDSILLSQPSHIMHGLEEHRFLESRPSSTPLMPHLQMSEALDKDFEVFKKLNRNFKSAIWLLNYIASQTCPDISYSVSSLAQFQNKPGLAHWRELKQTWQYLNHTKDWKLKLAYNESKGPIEYYSDASWAKDPISRKSQSGYLCISFGSLILWNSYKQQNITYSSTEAELNSFLDLYPKSKWVPHLLKEVFQSNMSS